MDGRIVILKVNLSFAIFLKIVGGLEIEEEEVYLLCPNSGLLVLVLFIPTGIIRTVFAEGSKVLLGGDGVGGGLGHNDPLLTSSRFSLPRNPTHLGPMPTRFTLRKDIKLENRRKRRERRKRDGNEVFTWIKRKRGLGPFRVEFEHQRGGCHPSLF